MKAGRHSVVAHGPSDAVGTGYVALHNVQMITD